MARRIRLTAGRVRAAQCPEGKGQVILRDAEQPGLGLRVTQAGSKSYIFQGKLNGHLIRMTLGDVQTLGLGDARARAAELRVQILEGRDPRQVKAETTARDLAKRQREQARGVTGLEVWSEYIEARRHRWGERHRQDHEAVVRKGGGLATRGRAPGTPLQDGILRPLLLLPLVQIDRTAVVAWIQPEAKRRPARARLAVSLLQAFLNWAAREYDAHADACKGIKREYLPAAKARQDSLERGQLAAWFSAVRQISSPTIAVYLQVLLLIGARRGELATLRWEDVDLRWSSMTIRDKVASRGGEDGTRTIPLTPYVRALLLELKWPKVRSITGNEKASLWVFPSATSASGHLEEPRLAHDKACRVAGIEGLSLHGLRRSFGTLSEWTEMPRGITDQIMGHRPTDTDEKHYRVRPLDLLRIWHEKLERWILEEAGIPFNPQQKPAKPTVFAVA